MNCINTKCPEVIPDTARASALARRREFEIRSLTAAVEIHLGALRRVRLREDAAERSDGVVTGHALRAHARQSCSLAKM
jgi:hypothetical protein